MKSLIYIGFKNIAVKSVIFFVVIIIYFYSIFTEVPNMDKSIFMLLPFILNGAIMINIYYAAEHSHWKKYMDALPLRRSIIVSQTFLFLMLFEAATMITAVVFHKILALLRIANIQDFPIKNILFFAVIALGLVGLMYFFVFTINYTAGIIVYMLICGAVGGMMGYLTELATDSDPAVHTAYQTFLCNIDKFFPVIALSCIAVFILSWIIAATAYSRKEF